MALDAVFGNFRLRGRSTCVYPIEDAGYDGHQVAADLHRGRGGDHNVCNIAKHTRIHPRLAKALHNLHSLV